MNNVIKNEMTFENAKNWLIENEKNLYVKQVRVYHGMYETMMPIENPVIVKAREVKYEIPMSLLEDSSIILHNTNGNQIVEISNCCWTKYFFV